MLNRILASAVIVVSIFGCASRTTTKNLNEDVQTIMTLGTNKLNRAVNDPTTSNDQDKTVRLSVSGVIVLSEKCQFSAFNTHYTIELRRKNSTRSKPVASAIITENMNYLLDTSVSTGEYTLDFIYYRKGKLLQSTPLKIDDSHDRFTFNFTGCP